MAAVAFSSDGAQVIERKSDLPEAQNSSRSEVEFQDFYELDRCAKWIQDKDVHRVALQFPDELLCDAASVISQLETQSAATLFVLGDTSYGSCCVDEVAAQHYDADAIIHFGRSCLSPTRRLPVLFVYGKSPIDVADCVEQFSQVIDNKSQKVVLMYDVTYHHAAVNIRKLLSSVFPSFVMSELQQENTTSNEPRGEGTTEELGQEDNMCQLCRCGRKLSIPKDSHIGDYSICYIGKEGLTLTNLMMNFNKFQFYSYNPVTKLARKETLNVNKALMKRFYMIERAKDAGIVGIVVGTLGVADYLSVINRLKELIKKAGKKSYTFVVGKLNVAKLANFMEVDIFVLVSCMENSLIDSSEFYKPVVTPFEMEVACNPDREWTGDYFTDFRDLLPGACGHVDIPQTISEEDQVDVSLVTGRVRNHGLQENQSSSAVIPRDEALAVSTTDTAAGFLSQRHWKGLEQKLGQTEATKAVDGQKGIAAGYSNEQEHS